MIQLLYPYLTTGKTIALTIQTFVGKVMSLLFNMMSRLFIAFIPKSKSLLISWLQAPSAVILEPKKIKFLTVSSSICHEVIGPDAMILVFLNVEFSARFFTLPRSVGAQYATRDQWRNNSRKNEGMEPKQKQHPVVNGTGDGSRVRCCIEQYCIGTWNVRSINQGKSEVVKQEMTRVNINILGISDLR